mmetsp:Transcript_18920/g.41683  ORF Transcript_18920/g.41683 Transcript_18920/m.41683 type:complete len:289 (+) Transcript_18920:62-928(+)
MGAVVGGNAQLAKVMNEPLSAKAEEIRVNVSRDGTRPIGVRVQIEVGSLTVLEIQAGLIKMWNEMNPHKAVVPGDAIASVNGRTSQSEILTELQMTERTRHLDMVFTRLPVESDVPEISAHIQRSLMRRTLGMDVEADSDGGLQVKSVREGLISEWNNNRALPNKTFQPGVRILSVNGQTEPALMKRELQSASVLRVQAAARTPLKRGTHAPGEFVKVVQLPFVKASDYAKDDMVCGICLDDVHHDTCVVRLTCGHLFHVECATKWLTMCNCACPVCRAPVRGSLSSR